MNSSPPLLSCQKIEKTYFQGRQLNILKGIDLDVNENEAICIVGDSGAGKSTLLHILGTLDRPTSGKVFFRGDDLMKKSDNELASFRNKTLGFVFQFHHLLSEFTALENVGLPARIGGSLNKEARGKAEYLLDTLGLNDRLHHYPTQLSGGEKQRVAIARALIQSPQILLADEPTGNLDTENTEKIQELFFDMKEKMGLTLIVVTHDLHFAKRFSRVMEIRDGHWDGARKSF